MLTLAAVGAWDVQAITTFLASIAVLLGVARLFGEIARRFRQPAVLGEILAGVLLGQTVLGKISPELFGTLFPAEGAASIALAGFTTLAVTLLLLVAGLEVDLSTVFRQGRTALAVSACGLTTSFTVGAALAHFAPVALGRDPAVTNGLPFTLFFGIAMAITALPVIAKILIDLNMSKSDIGVLVMSSAMIDDLIGWMGFATVLALMVGGEGHPNPATGVAYTIGGTFLFVAFMLSVGRWTIHRSLPFLQAHTAWPGGVLGAVLTMALAAAAFTEWLGIHAIFGAFITGIAVGDSSHLRERTRDTLHQFITAIVAPVFFASLGLQVDFLSAFDPVLVLVVLTIAIVVKVAGCSLGARLAGLSQRESLAVGFGMSARGAMEIILGQVALAMGLINERLFVAIVTMALVTSLIAGPVMERLLQRRRPPKLSDLLNDKQFVPQLQGTTVKEVIRELAQRAAAVTKHDADEIHRRVMERESIMGTALPGGLAVPHARMDVPHVTVVLGRSERGVDFNSPDGRPARLIFLLVSPTTDATAQVEALGIIARATQTEEARSAIASAATYTELLAALNATAPPEPH